MKGVDIKFRWTIDLLFIGLFSSSVLAGSKDFRCRVFNKDATQISSHVFEFEEKQMFFSKEVVTYYPLKSWERKPALFFPDPTLRELSKMVRKMNYSRGEILIHLGDEEEYEILFFKSFGPFNAPVDSASNGLLTHTYFYRGNEKVTQYPLLCHKIP